MIFLFAKAKTIFKKYGRTGAGAERNRIISLAGAGKDTEQGPEPQHFAFPELVPDPEPHQNDAALQNSWLRFISYLTLI
jgi:hypothetical protein